MPERERAPHECLPGQLDMWKDFATPSCNRVRAKNKPPEPDSDGFFDAAGATEICGRRQCTVAFASEFVATVTHKTKQVPLTAIAPGKWDPVSILKACSAACGRESFDADESTAKPTNPKGLDDIRIARVVAADGLRPYLSKRRKHRRRDDDGYVKIMRPRQTWMRGQFDRDQGDNIPFAAPGDPTWAFLQMMRAVGSDSCGHINSYEVRRAIPAVEDAGLVDIKLGPRGMATATVTWTERAYLPKPTPRPAALAAERRHRPRVPGGRDRMRESDDRPYAAILAADDWRPMAEYVANGEFVYVKGYAYRAPHPHV
jgi:hypothetical protein